MRGRLEQSCWERIANHRRRRDALYLPSPLSPRRPPVISFPRRSPSKSWSETANAGWPSEISATFPWNATLSGHAPLPHTMSEAQRPRLAMLSGDAIRWHTADAPRRCTGEAKAGRRDMGPGSRRCRRRRQANSRASAASKSWGDLGSSNVPHAWENRLNAGCMNVALPGCPLANYHPAPASPKRETQLGDDVESRSSMGKANGEAGRRVSKPSISALSAASTSLISHTMRPGKRLAPKQASKYKQGSGSRACQAADPVQVVLRDPSTKLCS